MNDILDFLVDNYIIVLIVCVFLILVLIGFIFDQKRKIKKVKNNNVGGTSGTEQVNINTPVQEEVKVNNEQVEPKEEKVQEQPVENNTTDSLVSESNVETTVEPVVQSVSNDIPLEEAPIINSDVNEQQNVVSTPIEEQAPTPVMEVPDNSGSESINVDETNNVGERSNTTIDNVVSEPISNTNSEPIVETIENTTTNGDNVAPEIIEEPKVENSQPEVIEEIKDEQPQQDNIETIEEIKDEKVDSNQSVNMWEPELVEESKEIVNQEQNKDSQ